MATSGWGPTGILLSAGLFGLTTFPIYSVAAAHAHDFASSDERVELSAALMFWFALGAIAAPYGASVLIEAKGPEAMFVMLAIGHAGLIVFGIARMRAPHRNCAPHMLIPRVRLLWWAACSAATVTRSTSSHSPALIAPHVSPTR